MSDPLLPVPDEGDDEPRTQEDRFDEVEDVEQPDVLLGAPDGEPEPEPEPEPTPFRAPAAGDRMSEDELRRDLGEE